MTQREGERREAVDRRRHEEQRLSVTQRGHDNLIHGVPDRRVGKHRVSSRVLCLRNRIVVHGAENRLDRPFSRWPLKGK